MAKNKKLAIKLGIQTCQILTNDDEVCIPSLSYITYISTDYSANKIAKRKK